MLAQIDYDELRGGIRKIVGSGSFGKVYLAHFHSARMAVKIISLEKDDPELKLKLLSFRYACAQTCLFLPAVTVSSIPLSFPGMHLRSSCVSAVGILPCKCPL